MSAETFIRETWQNPVFGDTFQAETEQKQEALLHWVTKQLGAIATNVVVALKEDLRTGMPEATETQLDAIVKQEILAKLIAFCAALTVGEIDDIVRLGAVSTAVGLMYWGDQTMDRGDEAMAAAIDILRFNRASDRADETVQARLSGLDQIKEHIGILARPEDEPYVSACFYEQVLYNEAVLHHLSHDYTAQATDEEKQAFLAAHAEHIARTTTVSAGLPSISSSLYAIYRHHDTKLPALSDVYANKNMRRLLQVCNVTVRLWDELGDWYMDAGHDPSKGVFVINPLNQCHPKIVSAYCRLAEITDKEQIASLQDAFANFHNNDNTRQQHSTTILHILRQHIRHYFAALDPALQETFGKYITLCKRVVEIGYVNRIGDIALTEGKDTP